MKIKAEYILPKSGDIIRELQKVQAISADSRLELFASRRRYLRESVIDSKVTGNSHDINSVIKIDETLYGIMRKRLFNALKNGVQYKGKFAFDEKGEVYFLKSIAIPKVIMMPDDIVENQEEIQRITQAFNREAAHAYRYEQATHQRVLVRNSGKYIKLYLMLKFMQFNAASIILPDPRINDGTVKLSNIQLLSAVIQFIQKSILIAKNGDVHRDIKLENYLIDVKDENKISVEVTDFEHMVTLESGQKYYMSDDCPTSIEYLPDGYALSRPKRMSGATDIYAALHAAELTLDQFNVEADVSDRVRETYNDLRDKVNKYKTIINMSRQLPENAGHPALTLQEMNAISDDMTDSMEKVQIQELLLTSKKYQLLSQLYQFSSALYEKLQREGHIIVAPLSVHLIDNFARECALKFFIMQLIKSREFVVFNAALEKICPEINVIEVIHQTLRFDEKMGLANPITRARSQYTVTNTRYWLLRFKKEWQGPLAISDEALKVDRFLDNADDINESMMDLVVQRLHAFFEAKGETGQSISLLQAWYIRAKFWLDVASPKYALGEVAKTAAYIFYQKNNFRFNREHEDFCTSFPMNFLHEFDNYVEAEIFFRNPDFYLDAIKFYINFFYIFEKHGARIVNDVAYRQKWQEASCEEVVQRLQLMPLKYGSIGRIFNDALMDSLLPLFYFETTVGSVKKIAENAEKLTNSVSLTHYFFVQKFLDNVLKVFFQDPGFSNGLLTLLHSRVNRSGNKYLAFLTNLFPTLTALSVAEYENLIMVHFSCLSLLQFISSRCNASLKYYVLQSSFLMHVQQYLKMFLDDKKIFLLENTAEATLNKAKQQLKTMIWQGKGGEDHAIEEEKFRVRLSDGLYAAVCNEVFPSFTHAKDLLNLNYYGKEAESLHEGDRRIRNNSVSSRFQSVLWQRSYFLNEVFPLLKLKLANEFSEYYSTWVHLFLYPAIQGEDGEYLFAWEVDSSPDGTIFWQEVCQKTLDYCIKHRILYCSAEEVFFLLKCFPKDNGNKNMPYRNLRVTLNEEHLWKSLHYLVQKNVRTPPIVLRVAEDGTRWTSQDAANLVIDNIFEYMAPHEENDSRAHFFISHYALFLIRSKLSLFPKEQEFLSRFWSKVYRLSINVDERTVLLNSMIEIFQQELFGLREAIYAMQNRSPGSSVSYPLSRDEYISMSNDFKGKLKIFYMRVFHPILSWNDYVYQMLKVEPALGSEHELTRTTSIFKETATKGLSSEKDDVVFDTLNKVVRVNARTFLEPALVGSNARESLLLTRSELEAAYQNIFSCAEGEYFILKTKRHTIDRYHETIDPECVLSARGGVSTVELQQLYDDFTGLYDALRVDARHSLRLEAVIASRAAFNHATL